MKIVNSARPLVGHMFFIMEVVMKKLLLCLVVVCAELSAFNLAASKSCNHSDKSYREVELKSFSKIVDCLIGHALKTREGFESFINYLKKTIDEFNILKDGDFDFEDQILKSEVIINKLEIVSQKCFQIYLMRNCIRTNPHRLQINYEPIRKTLEKSIEEVSNYLDTKLEDRRNKKKQDCLEGKEELIKYYFASMEAEQKK